MAGAGYRIISIIMSIGLMFLIAGCDKGGTSEELEIQKQALALAKKEAVRSGIDRTCSLVSSTNNKSTIRRTIQDFSDEYSLNIDVDDITNVISAGHSVDKINSMVSRNSGSTVKNTCVEKINREISYQF